MSAPAPPTDAPAARAPGADTPAHAMHPARSVLTDAYARLTEVFPALTVTELAPGQAAPRGDGWAHAARLAEGGPTSTRFSPGTRSRCCGTTASGRDRTS
jgi:hypothetical protein